MFESGNIMGYPTVQPLSGCNVGAVLYKEGRLKEGLPTPIAASYPTPIAASYPTPIAASPELGSMLDQEPVISPQEDDLAPIPPSADTGPMFSLANAADLMPLLTEDSLSGDNTNSVQDDSTTARPINNANIPPENHLGTRSRSQLLAAIAAYNFQAQASESLAAGQGNQSQLAKRIRASAAALRWTEVRALLYGLDETDN